MDQDPLGDDPAAERHGEGAGIADVGFDVGVQRLGEAARQAFGQEAEAFADDLDRIRADANREAPTGLWAS